MSVAVSSPAHSSDLLVDQSADTPAIRHTTDKGCYIDPHALVDCLPYLTYQHVIGQSLTGQGFGDQSQTEREPHTDQLCLEQLGLEQLCLEQVPLSDVAQQFATPCYVYSKTAIEQAYLAYANAFADLGVSAQVCYAVKANSNLAVLGVLSELGSGFDIVSAGELARVLAAGGDASKVVYSGVGKTASDVRYALEQGIGCFNVESVSELELIDRVAGQLKVQAPISLRINPNVDAGTHPYISTGLKQNKFGIAHEQALLVYKKAQALPNLNVVGIDCHIGSQLTETEPFLHALDKLLDLIGQLTDAGIEFAHIDIGGGLGVQYIDESVDAVADFAAAVTQKLKHLLNNPDKPMTLFLEPGRSIVANAGVLLTTVDVLKPSLSLLDSVDDGEDDFDDNEGKNFAIVDAAMNDLIRPALYESEMAVIPVMTAGTSKDASQAIPSTAWDIVGAICETGDFLAKSRLLDLKEHDLLAITGAGAYGFVMSSNYNTRPRACEVMVCGDKVQQVRARERLEDVFATETLAMF